MQKFWQLSLSLTAIYGAAVVGMSAAISHYFQYQLVTEEFSRLVSSTGVLAFQTLALLALGLYAIRAQQVAKEGTAAGVLAGRWSQGLLLFIAFGFHLGLWLFVYTVWAGLFGLPFYQRALAPVGGQLLLLSWVVLAVVPWISQKQK